MTAVNLVKKFRELRRELKRAPMGTTPHAMITAQMMDTCDDMNPNQKKQLLEEYPEFSDLLTPK